MFKKNIGVVSSRPLSGKDAKKLKKDVEQLYPELSEEDLKKLLPPKAEVLIQKLTNKVTVYSCADGNPLFFDPEGRGNALIPTVYTLWAFPAILPALFTYSEVSPKVLGGADLFLQGLIVPDEGLGTFSAGDVRAVRIPQNPFPFAVGMMEQDSTVVVKSGLKGKGLKLLHHYPDQLWALGDKSVPDPSFTTTRVFPQEVLGEGAADKADIKAAEQVSNLSIADTAPASSSQPNAADVEASNNDPELTVVDSPGAVPQDMDGLLEHCLLAALHSVQDSELPLLTSDLYSRHMVPARPAAAPALDIKKSSYKKLSKLLTTFEKKGVLGQKLVHKQDHIASINRQHELYLAAAGAATGPAGGSSTPSSGNGAAEAAAGPAAERNGAGEAGTSAGAARIEVVYVYRVPSSLRPIFGASAALDKDKLYTEDEVRAALQSYGGINGLLDGGSSSIKLDKLMVGGLFNKKEPQAEGDLHPLEDVVSRLLSKTQLHHKVLRPSPQGMMEVVGKGTIRNINIAMEDRQGGRKHITRVLHVESFAIDPDELAGVLQRRFQTSSSVTKLPGKSETGKEIALQGNLRKEVAQFLTATYGIDSVFIEDKTRVKS